MRGYTAVPLLPRGRWALSVYNDGRLEWRQVYANQFRARLAAWWLRVRGVKPL